MKILAIESAASVASVALIEDEKVVFDYTINNKRTHSQTIMPMIETMKKQLDLDMKTLDAIAVSSGPGSYTGLRIGSATAKGLAHVLNIPIIEVSTIEAMAWNIKDEKRIICPMLDARRQHVYSGAFRHVDGRVEKVIDIEQYSVEELLRELALLGKKVVFLGDGYTAHKKLIESSDVKLDYSVASADIFIQRAIYLAYAGRDKMLSGEVVDYLSHHPNYYRLSQAEREYQENSNGNS